MQPKSIALLQKIDSNIEQILQKFQDIFEVAIIQDKSKELLSVESLTIESNALMVIRLCEDLLTTTRTLKEAWCLGTVKVNFGDSTEEPYDTKAVFEKYNALTDKIAQFENMSTIATDGMQ
ncbi:uncharacterized protein AC631_03193 [Debaryomyces fabryi]|uniref:Mediator of RNA polymerase II transcription subunit 22 n=1 Tax=Debaryomyces fabryi TaxID=58627 RepID=A0A0V1PXU6_9ASCO|nr:uncharacterized protein AC631_03193 [Debaryomyces fabryi]KSA01069.1 hypothetical protein AC631_03193 [Debaryomyces fabryi]CUM47668.1 unnamed protein product [Debaryomyces fabryi]